MQFEISELAEFELDDAFQYYQQQEQGLGDCFIIEFSSAADRIRAFPEAYPPYTKQSRKCILNIFPYSIIYKLYPNLVFIVAIAHHKKDPKYLIRKL